MTKIKKENQREKKRNINTENSSTYNLNKQMSIKELYLWSQDLKKDGEK